MLGIRSSLIELRRKYRVVPARQRPAETPGHDQKIHTRLPVAPTHGGPILCPAALKPWSKQFVDITSPQGTIYFDAAGQGERSSFVKQVVPSLAAGLCGRHGPRGMQ